jgi:hypothetical protein
VIDYEARGKRQENKARGKRQEAKVKKIRELKMSEYGMVQQVRRASASIPANIALWLWNEKEENTKANPTYRATIPHRRR